MNPFNRHVPMNSHWRYVPKRGMTDGREFFDSNIVSSCHPVQGNWSLFIPRAERMRELSGHLLRSPQSLRGFHRGGSKGVSNPEWIVWLYQIPELRGKLHYVFDTGNGGIRPRARFSGKKGSFEPSLTEKCWSRASSKLYYCTGTNRDFLYRLALCCQSGGWEEKRRCV